MAKFAASDETVCSSIALEGVIAYGGDDAIKKYADLIKDNAGEIYSTLPSWEAAIRSILLQTVINPHLNKQGDD